MFAVPFFVLYIVFWAIPAVRGLIVSFHSDTLFGTPAYVGWAQYIKAARDPRLYTALGNTLRYAAATIFTVVPISIGLALIMQALGRGARALFRFILILPALTPPVVMGIIFLLVFGGPYGLLNRLIFAPLGAPDLDWLKDPRLIPWGLVIQGAWRWIGFITWFILAGLDGIRNEYYDAAKNAGASSWQILRHITLPLLRPIAGFAAFLLAFDALVLFAGSYVLLGEAAGTGDSGLLLVTYMYQTAFSFGRFGQAAAASYMLVPLWVLIAWLFMRYNQGRIVGRHPM